ncbi:RhoGEF domain containing protein [Brugia malayi]|uniref:RhoGEF domain containing protein n=1 Tax=Brugia malayi TaxID=6279 RepID=A0A4E9F1V5_BRUMA|nr:RhoGEF domain containing protein [Brugia malayi]VIO88460.1 RhoGEF domain containing protein [Brugia malayi]
MIRRQVFHLSLRAKQKANYTSNRECKSSRNTITDFPDDDSNEPLSHFVDECCMDENELSRNGKHFKRRQIEVLHDNPQNAFICGKNAEYGGPVGNSSDSSSSGVGGATIGFDQPASLLNFAISELVNTEQSYVRELKSIVDFYIRPFEAPENEHLITSHLRDRSDILFVIYLIIYFNYLLADFLAAGNSINEICRCFLNHRNKFLQLYHHYCQNKPLGEALRREQQPDGAECQKRAGHPLPLSAYLLKPVQRITKYQLLLKEVHRHCSDQAKPHVDEALASMLDLLAQLNTAMHQLHIAGFVGDLCQMGPLRLQNECDIYPFKKRTRRLNKPQRRHLFLFDGGLLFCKKRSQSLPYASEYYEHKLSIPTCSLGFSETSKTSSARFEVWDETKNEAYVVQPIDESARIKWIQRLYSQQHRPMRPQSWASTISTDSIRSSDTTTDGSVVDGNGNNSNGIYCSSPSSGSPTFVPIISDEDPDNNITTNDQLQTRSYSCPENSLGSLSPSPLSSSTTTTKPITTATIPSAGVLNTILAKSLTTTTATPLNTIIESSSSTELFATI